VSHQAVIIDTNVADGTLGAAFPLVMSEALLAECRTVLVRPGLRKLHGLTVAERKRLT
jgi:hypothetical protein